MSNNVPVSVADVLIMSAVKTVGKREFLRTVEKLYGSVESKVKAKAFKIQNKATVPSTEQCVARVKGDRTGIKVGRFVLFDAQRCGRHEISQDSHLCPIHTNQVSKFGELSLGTVDAPLSESQKKVFGEI